MPLHHPEKTRYVALPGITTGHPMKFLITGMNGTVAPVVARTLARAGHETVTWDRAAIATEEAQAIRGFITRVHPDWIFHIGMGSPDWAATMAQTCADLGIRFLFTSTVSVFKGGPPQRLTISHTPDAEDDYGRYKIDCENRIRAILPQALIARLAWQIGDAPGKNHMLTYLEKQADGNGQIQANTRWHPSCCFLEDTADCLLALASESCSGTYHLEGNPGLNMAEIAQRLSRRFERPWNILPVDQPAYFTLMDDARTTVFMRQSAGNFS